MEKKKLIEKIKKLFALASNNTNESEAQAALLKARQLMAENNLEVSQGEQQGRRDVVVINLKWQGHYNFGISLALVVAKNFGCKALKGANYLALYGCEGDVEVAAEVFGYAYDFAHRAGLEKRREARRAGESCRGILNTYGEGFTAGLRNAYGEQSKQLAIVIPEEVNEYGRQKHYKTSKHYHSDSVSGDVFRAGYDAGYNFLGQNAKRISA